MKINTLFGEEEYPSRICSECKIEKPINEFSMDTTYVRSKCKECKGNHGKQVNSLRKQYPKPESDYACPICGDTVDDMKDKGYVRTSWCLDHCHTTGEFRGYICHLCNTGISNLQESPEIIQNALNYLMRKRSGRKWSKVV